MAKFKQLKCIYSKVYTIEETFYWGLDKWVQQTLILIPEICKSRSVRRFKLTFLMNRQCTLRFSQKFHDTLKSFLFCFWKINYPFNFSENLSFLLRNRIMAEFVNAVWPHIWNILWILDKFAAYLIFNNGPF